MAGPPQQTFTNVTPIQSAPQTFSNVTPIGQGQPSVSDVLTQPTDKTDQEYKGYRGAAGVAGATVKGLDDVARGTQAAVKGAWDTVTAPPADTTESVVGAIPGALPIYRAVKGLVSSGKQAPQVPAAIHDINQSPDPLSHYADAAQDTASQGAGQALTGLGTEGVAKVGADVAPYVGPVGKAVVKGYAKKFIPGEIGEAIKAVKGVQNPDPALAQSQPLASSPTPAAKPAAQTGEALGQVPASGSSAESFGKSRTLPGQVSPETVRPPQTPPATPIPPRSGLALPPAPKGAELSELPPTGARSQAQTGEALPAVDKGLQNLLNDSLGGKPLQPNVPLKNQLPAHGEYMQRFKSASAQPVPQQGAPPPTPAAPPEHMGQFARANGLDLHQAIPESVEGDVLRAKIHNLTNVQVRELAINAGEDMGQQSVTNAKNAGGATRQEVLSRILAKHTPEEIGQMIDQGQHLAPSEGYLTPGAGVPPFSSGPKGVQRGSIASALSGRNGR
jgi:hypothetical protein